LITDYKQFKSQLTHLLKHNYFAREVFVPIVNFAIWLSFILGLVAGFVAGWLIYG